MKDAEKKAWIYQTSFACNKALLVIEAAKKQATSSFDRRTRMIEGLQRALFVKESDEGQTELFEPSSFLTPELRKILDDPVEGL